MDFKDLLQKLAERRSDWSYREAKEFLKKKNIQPTTSLPDAVSLFIDKFQSEAPLTQEETDLFSKALKKIPKEQQRFIKGYLLVASETIYTKYKDDIDKMADMIDKSEGSHRFPDKTKEGIERFRGVLNIQMLYSSHPEVKPRHESYNFPGATPNQERLVFHEPIFAVNILRIAGHVPKEGHYASIDLSKPVWPISVTSKDPVPKAQIKKHSGIKSTDEYWPYKQVRKIARGDTGDVVFLATNGKKALYVRGIPRPTPQAVLTSKVARLISPNHFSSERLLSNHLVGSRRLDGYAYSVADIRVKESREDYIYEQQGVFPGTGIVDEVCNYVGESDPNIENFGLSSDDMEHARVSKIDFDCCTPYGKVNPKSYERDILTGRGGIYHGEKWVKEDQGYQKEKLATRLKLSLLTVPLLEALADKSYTETDRERKDKAVAGLSSRSEVALDLFLSDERAITLLVENPGLLTTLQAEINDYIDTHFEEGKRDTLKASVSERVKQIESNPLLVKPIAKQNIEIAKGKLKDKLEKLPEGANNPHAHDKKEILRACVISLDELEKESQAGGKSLTEVNHRILDTMSRSLQAFEAKQADSLIHDAINMIDREIQRLEDKILPFHKERRALRRTALFKAKTAVLMLREETKENENRFDTVEKSLNPILDDLHLEREASKTIQKVTSKLKEDMGETNSKFRQMKRYLTEVKKAYASPPKAEEGEQENISRHRRTQSPS